MSGDERGFAARVEGRDVLADLEAAIHAEGCLCLSSRCPLHDHLGRPGPLAWAFAGLEGALEGAYEVLIEHEALRA